MLYQAVSPCGKFVVTGAGDETLRFWDLGYPKEEPHKWKGFSLEQATGLFGYGGSKGKNKSGKKGSRLEIPVLR